MVVGTGQATAKFCSLFQTSSGIMSTKKGLLERLDAGDIIVGDGGMIHELELRGYSKAGSWLPECVIEHPDAVRELHREYVRAGADVLQALTFNSSDGRLHELGVNFSCEELNRAACQIAQKVAAESDRPILVAGCLSESHCYKYTKDKHSVQAEFEVQMKPFIENDVDFVVAEYFRYCEEICWAVETLKKANKPIVAMMNIGEMGDRNSSMSTGQCAVKIAEAGADVIGLNCCFDPQQSVEAMKDIKKCLEEAGFKKHLICQPLGKWTPDAGRDGYLGLPEFPFALEPRQVTRFDMNKFAREAYNAGIRYIGGCCAVASYQIRAIAEELSPERGFLPIGSEKHEPWGGGMSVHSTPWISSRSTREYWENLIPATGRIYSSAMSETQFQEE